MLGPNLVRVGHSGEQLVALLGKTQAPREVRDDEQTKMQKYRRLSAKEKPPPGLVAEDRNKAPEKERN